jgi:hypothetical protein
MIYSPVYIENSASYSRRRLGFGRRARSSSFHVTAELLSALMCSKRSLRFYL